MRWFVHGKWPRVHVWLHHYTIVSFVLLLFSGLALYLPAWHARLIPYLPAIYAVHIALGLIFLVTLFIPLWQRVPKEKRLRLMDWVVPMVTGPAIIFTGFVLWQVGWFPASWRNHGFTWHGALSYVLAAWVVFHALLKAFRPALAERVFRREADLERRRFVKWIASGTALGLLGATWLDGILSFPLRLFRFTGGAMLTGGDTTTDGRGTVVGLSSGLSANGQPLNFEAFYTVTPDGSYPHVHLAQYRLVVDGLVSNPLSLTLDAIKKLSPHEEVRNFQCVTGWAVADVPWKGVQLSEIMRAAAVLPSAKFVQFYSFDGLYTESLTLDQAKASDVLLAYELGGEPLRVEQGYPLRLVVPSMYGYKSIKWLNRVSFTDKLTPGYWEQRGYPVNAAYS